MTTITTRAGKGAPLSNAEVDANFNNLNNDKIEASDTRTLTNKTISGASNTITGVSLTTGVTGTLPVANGGTGTTTSTGSGSVVLSTSPTLVTPVLGTPASGNLANCTFPTLNQNTTGTAAGLSVTLAVSSGGTGTTTSTGSGSVVLSTSPSLTTPVLGTPASGDLANCTFPTLNQNTTGNAGTVTNGVYTTGSYANPAWLTSLAETKVLPSQGSNSGKYLKTDGTNTSWASVDALPSQSGNSGKYLTTNGSAASWAALNVDPNTTTKGLYEMANTISANYTIANGNNAMSAGPITINSGITVTIPSGSVWTIV